MHARVFYLLAAAVAVAAMPATTVSQSQAPGAHVEAVTKKPASVPHTKSPANIKAVNMKNINLGQCSDCLGAVTSTIGSCQPILDGWTGWFHIPECIKQVENDFNVLTSCCIPCLESFVG